MKTTMLIKYSVYEMCLFSFPNRSVNDNISPLRDTDTLKLFPKIINQTLIATTKYCALSKLIMQATHRKGPQNMKTTKKTTWNTR